MATVGQKQVGKTALLYVADGSPVSQLNKTDVTVSVVSSTPQLNGTTTNFVTAGFLVGQRVLVTGCVTNPASFYAYITNVTSSIAKLKYAHDLTGAAVTLVAETPTSVSLVAETFIPLQGQKSTQHQMQAASIDTTDKTTGNWGSKIAGLNTLTINCSGQIAHGDPAIEQLRIAILNSRTINLQSVENNLGDQWVGTFSITNESKNFPDNNVGDFSFVFENSGAPFYVKAS